MVFGWRCRMDGVIWYANTVSRGSHLSVKCSNQPLIPCLGPPPLAQSRASSDASSAPRAVARPPELDGARRDALPPIPLPRLLPHSHCLFQTPIELQKSCLWCCGARSSEFGGARGGSWWILPALPRGCRRSGREAAAVQTSLGQVDLDLD